MLTHLGAEAALGSTRSCSQAHFPVHGFPVPLWCSEAQIIRFGEQVRCLEDMGLERDLFAWDNRHLTNLFQFTDWCFSLGVSLSILVVQSANSA